MNLRAQLQANGASPLAIAWRCDQDPLLRQGGAQGLPNALGGDLQRGGEAGDGGGAGLGDQSIPQLVERALVDASQLGDLAYREPALVDQVVQSLGHGGSLPSSEEIHKVPLDFVPNSADDRAKKSPGRVHLSTDDATEAIQQPQGSQTMTTLQNAPKPAQQNLSNATVEQLREAALAIFENGDDTIAWAEGIGLVWCTMTGRVAITDPHSFWCVAGSPVTNERAVEVLAYGRRGIYGSEVRKQIDAAEEKAERLADHGTCCDCARCYDEHDVADLTDVVFCQWGKKS